MVSRRDSYQNAEAERVISWLQAPDATGHPFALARRLGVMYMIWNNKIWGAYAADQGWRPYRSCASQPERAFDTTCHRDHIHFSLSWAGAMARTSFWSGSVAVNDFGPCRAKDLNWAPAYSTARTAPCPAQALFAAPAGATSNQQALVKYSGARIVRGSTGPIVSIVQQALGMVPDGRFGPSTTATVIAYQAAHALAQTGAMNYPTWRSLLLANGLGSSAPTPPPNRSTDGSSSGSSSTGSGSPLTRFTNQVLRPGDRGAAVLAVQKRLKVPGANGYFGPATRTAVLALQKRHGIRTTGNVGPLTWAALGA
jgi:peptidoglycan hydrolase-like protein with peptidoglycan-binding domain